MATPTPIPTAIHVPYTRGPCTRCLLRNDFLGAEEQYLVSTFRNHNLKLRNHIQAREETGGYYWDLEENTEYTDPNRDSGWTLTTESGWTIYAGKPNTDNFVNPYDVDVFFNNSLDPGYSDEGKVWYMVSPRSQMGEETNLYYLESAATNETFNYEDNFFLFSPGYLGSDDAENMRFLYRATTGPEYGYQTGFRCGWPFIADLDQCFVQGYKSNAVNWYFIRPSLDVTGSIVTCDKLEYDGSIISCRMDFYDADGNMVYFSGTRPPTPVVGDGYNVGGFFTDSFYSHYWFDIAEIPQTGPMEITVDGVQLVDTVSFTSTTCLEEPAIENVASGTCAGTNVTDDCVLTCSTGEEVTVSCLDGGEWQEPLPECIVEDACGNQCLNGGTCVEGENPDTDTRADHADWYCDCSTAFTTDGQFYGEFCDVAVIDCTTPFEECVEDGDSDCAWGRRVTTSSVKRHRDKCFGFGPSGVCTYCARRSTKDQVCIDYAALPPTVPQSWMDLVEAGFECDTQGRRGAAAELVPSVSAVVLSAISAIFVALH